MSENDTATLDIFKLKEDDLYEDDDAPENEEEELNRPVRKMNRGKLLVAIACVAVALAVCGLGFGVNRAIAVSKLNKELTAAKQEIQNRDVTINDLNGQIIAKDTEIAQLKDQKTQTGTVALEGDTKKADAPIGGKEGFGTDGSIYKVTSETGMNIRESASADAEAIASLAKGDEFEQEGDPIKNDDGSV